MKKLNLKVLLASGLASLVFATGCNSTKNLVLSRLGQYHYTIPNLKALEEIVLSNSANSQTVMFGETHKKYRVDSDFVIGLLPRLKAQGFEYFALEMKRQPTCMFHIIIREYALGRLKRKDIKPKWIRSEKKEATGWFDLIDAVKEAGMKIVCYDSHDLEYTSFNQREELSFNNLQELIFKENPDAKVIVYCGCLHTNEKSRHDPDVADWERRNRLLTKDYEKHKYLAVYLDEYTKDKNLTIDLANYYDPKDCDLKINLDKGTYECKPQH